MRHISSAALALVTSLCMAQFGPYERFAPSTTSVVGTVLVDLDDDGDVDLLEYRATYAGATGALMWRVNDGTGTFSEAVPFSALVLPSVENLPWVADLNGDGKPDLVGSATTEEEIRWFRNAGGGVFVPMPAITGTTYHSICEAFDVDQDGDQDLVIKANGIMYAENTDGAGTFAPLVEMGDIPVANDLAMGDPDGDGDLDLAFIFYFSHSTILEVCLQTAPATFVMDQVNTLPLSSWIAEYGMAWLDMDGDGDVDLVGSSADSLIYFPYDGTSDLGEGLTSAVNTGILRAWNTVDFDNDGDPDLVASANGRLVWVETLAPGSFTTHFSQDLVVTFEQVSIGDIDSDGDLDAMAFTPTGRLQAWNEMEAGEFGTWHVLYAEPDEPADVDAADIDGDGDLDVVVAAPMNGVVGWYANTDGAGAFGSFNLIRAAADSVLAIDAADLDGDGDMDIVCAEAGSGLLNWLENNGDGTAWMVHALGTGLSRPNTVRIIDLANDGDPDVVFTTHGDESFQVCWNNAGSFSAPQLIGSIGAGPSSMDVADFNHDDQWDVVISAQATGTNDIVLFKGSPDGTAFEPMQVVQTGVNDTRQVWAQDVDEDTHVDLFYVHESNGRVSRLNGDGQGLFCCTTTMTATNLNIQKMEMADFDSDGYYDMVVMRSGNNGALFYHGQGGGSFDPGVPTITTTWTSGTDLTVFDKDADGDPDLLVSSNGNDEVGTFENYFGSPFRIDGTVFLDIDGNGQLNAGDELAPFIPVHTTPTISIPYTDPQGAYTFYLLEGAYTVEAPFVSPCWALTTASATYNEVLTAVNPIVSGRDFGYGIDCDTTIVAMTHATTSMCYGSAAIHLHLFNSGTTLPQGMMRVILDPLTTFSSSTPVAAQQVGDTVWIAIDQLGYFEHRTVRIVVDAPGSDFIGDTLHFDVRFDAEDDLGSPLGATNTAWEQRVLCGFDPNDKAVEPAGAGALGLIPIDTERLIYTIRFQNTGNDTATTVVIHDQLSPQLDHGSLQVLGWTHPFTLSVEAGGEALFTFNNIMLPDSGADQLGSQGHLIFSIAPLPASPAGTVIENTARIVFDLNEPVITNSTLNTLFDCLLASTSIADLGDNTLLAGPGLHYQWALDGVDLPGADQQALVATESGSYTVTVTDSIGCTPTSAPYALIITAVAALNASSIITHPDPFTHTTTVVLPTDPADGTVLQVIDAQGRCVMLVPANSRSITLHGDELGTGVFTLRCITKDGSIYRVGRVVHLR